jgi:hypothetical protein
MKTTPTPERFPLRGSLLLALCLLWPACDSGAPGVDAGLDADAAVDGDAGDGGCTPDCQGRECGLEPACGSSCGACPGGLACSAAGQCEETCTPDCQDRACGLDPVCDALDCGACPAGEECDEQGRCVPACAPDCQGRACGPDPICGTLECGVCPAEERCDALGQCQPACGEHCEPFSIAILPDTQYYTAKQAAGPDNTLFKQLRWVLDHRASHDIRFVIHVGDVTHHNTPAQWAVADEAFRALDEADMPYSVVPGNHDYLKAGAAFSRAHTLLNETFPPSRFAHRPWYGGAYRGSSENSHALFEAGPYRFLVVNLEYGPRKQPLCWAEEIIARHPDRRVIVVSHCVQTHGGAYNLSCPSPSYLVPGGSGETIWNELASRHSNVFLVLSGHVNDSEYRLRHGHAGNPVHGILTDYQMEGDLGNCHTGFFTGNGWMRELVFDPRANRVIARTFTVEEGNRSVFPGGVPALFCDDYSADPAAGDHQFEFAYDLSSSLGPHQRTEGSRAFTDLTVNSLSAGDQLRPRLASRGAGGWVAVWADDSSTTDGPGNFDIMMRGFGPSGCQAFTQRQVNPEGAGQQRAPAVGMAADGSFAVAWEDDTDGNGSFQIHARGFHADGSERLPRFTVNTVSTGQQRAPAVAVAPDGRFAVAWEDDRDRDGDMQVWVRGFEADGRERFAERSVHTDDLGNRQRPALAALPDGGLVVVWEDDGDGNGVYQIHARGLRADGGERFARLTVNSAAAGQQRNPVIGADSGGGFAVAWEDDQDGDGNFQLLARGFEPDGRQRFADFRVHAGTGGQRLGPALGVAEDGSFAVAWEDDGDGNGAYQIRAAGFTAQGAAAFTERTVNRVPDGQQRAPAVALDDRGLLVVAWEDDMDGNGTHQLLARGLDWTLP